MSMTDFLKMDIFFATTTAVVFLLGLFLIVALFYVIKILRRVDHVAENIAEESDSIRGDIGVLRTKIRDEGVKLKHFGEFFEHIVSRSQGRRPRKSEKE